MPLKKERESKKDETPQLKRIIFYPKKLLSVVWVEGERMRAKQRVMNKRTTISLKGKTWT